MNNPKRGTGRPYIHEDCQPAKRPRIVKPKTRKPTMPCVEFGNFELERDYTSHGLYYDWIRKSRYDYGRPFCFQHEPFHFKHQQNPSMVYVDNFNERRYAPVYQVDQNNSAYLQPSGSQCKTKIFNPGGYMRSTGCSRINERKLGGDQIHYNGSLPFLDRKSFFENRPEMRPKSINRPNYRNKRQTTEVKSRETHGRQDEENCKRDEPKEVNVVSGQKIDRERQPSLIPSSTESQPNEARREKEDILEERNSESDTREVKNWRRERKKRRKAFTVASNLMEKINDLTEEKKQTADTKTSKNESEAGKKCKDTRTGENVACRVFGLLSLQGSRERRYEITVEELKRRVSAPEHLNKVDMISYLRLAKNSARLLLEKYDIISSLHHRLSKHTILSKVSERECDDLATGIHDINTSFFPFRAMAQQSIGRIKEMGTNGVKETELLKKRYQDLETTRSVLMGMCGTLEALHSTTEMNDFKNLTHTFGIQNVSNHVKFFDKYLKEEEEMIIETMKNK